MQFSAQFYQINLRRNNLAAAKGNNKLQAQTANNIAVYNFQNNNLKTAENGVEILKKIKEASPTSAVIMLSGQDKISVAVECMKNGAYDYVIKSESAFTRIENIFNNIGKHMKTVHQLKIYKIGFRILIGAIILIAIAVFIAVKMGWATAHMGGFD